MSFFPEHLSDLKRAIECGELDRALELLGQLEFRQATKDELEAIKSKLNGLLRQARVQHAHLLAQRAALPRVYPDSPAPAASACFFSFCG